MFLTYDSRNISVKITNMKSDQTRLDILTYCGSRLEELDLATTKREMELLDSMQSKEVELNNGLQSLSLKGKGERSGTWP